MNEIFTDDVSRRDARKYRRRGLDIRAKRMLHALEQRVALKGHTSLEIGIGTGGFTVELLRRGVSAATGVDAIQNQLQEAKLLADENGVADRLSLRHGDFTDLASELAPADLVVLDRVVCCYPDWEKLVRGAATHAHAAVVMSYPREAWYNRIWIASANLAMRMLRRAFRLHLHPPRAMHAMLHTHGFQSTTIGHRFVWEFLVATRTV